MKTELILLLYDALVCGGSVARKNFCAEHSLSERTFYRYMREVSAFVRAHKPEYIIDIAEPQGRYYLKKLS